ncbi:MAG: hypothetical protein AAF581_17185 [Planctomycetota bacterium]
MTALLGWMFEKGSAPILEQSMNFTEARHRLILSNVANADTPHYRRLDLDKKGFNRALESAIERRREHHPGRFSMTLDLRVPTDDRGHYLPGRWLPTADHEGPLRHDNNNVSLEREMAVLAQNAGSYRRAAGLLRKQYGQIRAAIAERA